MTRLPIRARLTAAFALAMVLLLVGAGLFVYVRLRSDLDENVDESLRVRAAAAGTSGMGTLDAEDGFAQLVARDGRLVKASGGARGAVLSAEERVRAERGPVELERRVAGIDGEVRVLARPYSGPEGAAVVVAGASLEDRDETLHGLVTSFAVGGPLAVALASLLGYALASAGLAPVEAMRRRAAQVSLDDGDPSPLPLPAARDEVRRLGETLNEMLDRLRVSFERERRFVADASHELRTPVAVLKTELEGALRSGDYGPRVKEALVASIEECDHLGALAEDLLVIARAGEGDLPVRPERLDARSALEGVRDRFADRAAERGRPIRVEAPPGLALSADPLRLRQALGNLVDNTLRHGDGEITLTARQAEHGVELVVADRGPGFGDDLRERAFERFTRGDAARTRGGAGLGLSIVRAVARAHGGEAALLPGPGAAVCVRLPSQGALT